MIPSQTSFSDKRKSVERIRVARTFAHHLTSQDAEKHREGCRDCEHGGDLEAFGVDLAAEEEIGDQLHRVDIGESDGGGGAGAPSGSS
ncbi:MAG: hypothetical protein R3D59_18780 [Paracoccaceae bacterium]